MSCILYKFKFAGKKKIKNVKPARKLYRINTIMLITPNSDENYTTNFEDNDYRIEVRTNITKETGNQKSLNFKSKVTNEGKLLVETNLISNFDFRTTSKNVDGLFFKTEYSTEFVYITITFYPKRIESIGRFNLMRINVPKKKLSRTQQNNKPKTSSHIKIFQGGGCSGK